MRTTVAIDDGLLKTAKQHAEAEQVTLGRLIETALRLYLARPEDRPRFGPPLPVFRGGGSLATGVDLTSNAALYESMYAEEDARTRAQLGAGGVAR